MKTKAPYGSWPSQVTTQLMTAGTIGLSENRLFEGGVYWLESRPEEQGRTAIMRQSDSGAAEELLPAEYSCRTRVHEYGGACYLPTASGLFFVNHEDQQVYRVDSSLTITKLTDEPGLRFADLVFNAAAATLIAVAEEHNESFAEPANRLVSIDAVNGTVTTLHHGQDFYASPAISDDFTKLSWLTWMHPNMPWDGTTLWQAEFDGSDICSTKAVAGGDAESIVQPEWSPSGQLFFVSDKSNWWNLYRLIDGKTEAVCPREAEFGLPLWQFGMTRYGFIDDNTIVTSYTESGVEHFACIDINSGQLQHIDHGHSAYSSVRAEAGRYCYIAQSATEFPSLKVGDLNAERQICSASTSTVDTSNYSVAEPVTFATGSGAQAHGFFYQPANVDYEGPENELPPLLVMIHGGPTSATSSSLSYKIQYWTSRGFAVLDVNYRGSTGFGRKYRDALKRQWGISDVEDCDYGVRYLIDRGLVDENRVAIRGGSAGGYTVLAALANTETFKAGTSLYGVSDLTALAADTHKFEARYLDSLIGPYPAEKELYEQRSPISHASSITVPVLFLQGSEDKVVPPSQAEMMIDKLKANKVPVAYLLFDGEAHGFRKSETITRAYEAELWFYGSVFGFDVEDAIDPVEFI